MQPFQAGSDSLRWTAEILRSGAAPRTWRSYSLSCRTLMLSKGTEQDRASTWRKPPNGLHSLAFPQAAGVFFSPTLLN
jgi:hypothetical protein